MALSSYPTTKILVLAGNRQQFEEYVYTHFPPLNTLPYGSDPYEAFVYGDSRKCMLGIDFDEVITTGTFWERQDASDLYNYAQSTKSMKTGKNLDLELLNQAMAAMQNSAQKAFYSSGASVIGNGAVRSALTHGTTGVFSDKPTNNLESAKDALERVKKNSPNVVSGPKPLNPSAINGTSNIARAKDALKQIDRGIKVERYEKAKKSFREMHIAKASIPKYSAYPRPEALGDISIDYISIDYGTGDIMVRTSTDPKKNPVRIRGSTIKSIIMDEYGKFKKVDKSKSNKEII